MSTRTYKSSIPLDTLRMGADARVQSEVSKRDPNYYIPKNVEIVLQFLAQPTDASATGWFSFRVAPVKSILIPGVWNAGQYAGTPRADLPWQLRDVVMEDTELVSVNGRELYKFTYPRMEVYPGVVKDVLKEVLDGRSQNFAERDGGRTRVEWQVLTNAIVWEWPEIKKKDGSAAVRPGVGQHIGVRMSRSQADTLAQALAGKVKEAAREGTKIDILDYRWYVEFAAGPGGKLTLSRGTRITEPIEVEPFDFEAQVLERLDAFEEHVKAAYADLNGPAQDAVDDAPEWAKPDEAETAEATDLFSMVSTSALRKKAKDAGYVIPPGTGRPALIEWLVENTV